MQKNVKVQKYVLIHELLSINIIALLVGILQK